MSLFHFDGTLTLEFSEHYILFGSDNSEARVYQQVMVTFPTFER